MIKGCQACIIIHVQKDDGAFSKNALNGGKLYFHKILCRKYVHAMKENKDGVKTKEQFKYNKTRNTVKIELPKNNNNDKSIR